MFWEQILTALRTVAHLFSTSGPVLAMFWLAHWQAMQVPSALSAALGLQLAIRFGCNLANLRKSGQRVPRVVLVVLLSLPVLTLMASDAWLMVVWPTATAGFAYGLWKWPRLRAVEEDLWPAPIDEVETWIDLRAAVALATAGLGLALSVVGDPALWITGVLVGKAAFELTAFLWLSARGDI